METPIFLQRWWFGVREILVASHQTHKKSPYVYRKPHPATSSVLDGSNRCLTTLGLKKPGQVKFLGASDATFLAVPGFGSFGLPLLSRFRTAPFVAARRPGLLRMITSVGDLFHFKVASCQKKPRRLGRGFVQ